VELSSRAPELGLSADELQSLEPGLSAGLVLSLLATIVRYEDALVELAADKLGMGGARPAEAALGSETPERDARPPSRA
jgi:hypothetical protein